MADGTSVVVDMSCLLHQLAALKDCDNMDVPHDLCKEIDQIRDAYNRDINALRKYYTNKLETTVKKYQGVEEKLKQYLDDESSCENSDT